MNIITISKKVELGMKDQGRKKNWLAEQLEISRPTLDKKLKDNFWVQSEIGKLHSLGIIE